MSLAHVRILSVSHGCNPNATSASRIAFPISHVAAAALYSLADSSPLWRLLAQKSRECGCGHADVFLEICACFLLGRAAPDFRASSILLHREGVLALKLRLHKLLCFAYEKDFVRLLATGTGSAPAGSYLADRCDLFLGFVNCVARLQRQQIHRTAALHCTGIHGLHGLIMHFNRVHQWVYNRHNL